MATAQTGRKLQFTSTVELNGLLSPKHRYNRASDYTLLVSWAGEYPKDKLRRNEALPVAAVAKMVQEGTMGGHWNYASSGSSPSTGSKRGYHRIQRWPFFDILMKKEKSHWTDELEKLFRKFTNGSGQLPTGKAREYYSKLQRFGGRIVRRIREEIKATKSPELSPKTRRNRRYLQGQGRNIKSDNDPLVETGQMMRSVVVEVIRNDTLVSLKEFALPISTRPYETSAATGAEGTSVGQTMIRQAGRTQKPSEAYTPEFNIEGKGLFDDIFNGEG